MCSVVNFLQWGYNKNMQISLIIPCLNAEKYLGRCLDSIMLALLDFRKKAEVIIVDNGSNDGTLDIVQDYQKKFLQRNMELILLHCTRPGASAARNMGVTQANGEYIWFVDADDRIDSSAISKLYYEAHHNKADLVMMGAERIYSNSRKDYLSAVMPSEPDYKSRFVRYGAGPWQFIIRREWWTRNKFSFREGIIHEDMELISALILYVDVYTAINEPLYYYYQNDDSVLHKSEWDPHYLDIFVALRGLYNRFATFGAARQFHDELEWFFIWNLLIDSNKDFSKFPEGRVGFARSRKMLRHYFPHWRHNRFLKAKSWKLRARVLINYYK